MKNAALALLLTTTPALADITPEDVLESWRTYYAGFGATITVGTTEATGKTSRFGNVLTQMNMAGTEARYHFDHINMQANPDGSVDISFGPGFTGTSYADLPNGAPFTSQMSYDLTALSIHATGSPGDIHYTYSAPQISAQQSQSGAGSDTTFTTEMSGITGEADSLIEVTESGPRVFDALTLQYETVRLHVTSKTGSATATISDISVAGLTMSYQLGFPQIPIPQTPQKIAGFPENMDIESHLAAGPLVVTATEGAENRFDYSQNFGEMSIDISPQAFGFTISAEAAEMVLLNGAPLAPSFSASFGSALFGMSMPIAKSDTDAPFSLTTSLSDFTLGEELWATFDPENTLSHSPAGFSFSVSGTIKLLVDIFDQSALTNLRSAPAEIHSLSLDTLMVDFEGMGLSGGGDVTFNNNRIDPMSGLPEPTGVLDFSVNGALGLLDKIGQLGIGDPMMIIGAKGMFGMFATPNSGPDSFTSRVEFAEGGSISVNGLQVK